MSFFLSSLEKSAEFETANEENLTTGQTKVDKPPKGENKTQQKDSAAVEVNDVDSNDYAYVDAVKLHPKPTNRKAGFENAPQNLACDRKSIQYDAKLSAFVKEKNPSVSLQQQNNNLEKQLKQLYGVDWPRGDRKNFNLYQ